MSDYLTGITEKIKRAEHHVGELKSTWDDFRKGDPYSVARTRHPKTGYYLFQFQARQSIPLPMSTIVGDLIHNLRTALDYAMCGLYVANGEVCHDRVYFPIADDADKLIARLPGIERGAGQHVMQYIQLVEPYKGGAGHPLWQLHKLDIRDKHHLLIPALGRFEQMNDVNVIPADWDIPNDTRRSMSLSLRPAKRCGLEDGAILFDTPDVNMNPKFVIDVALEEPGVVECQPIFPAAREFIDFVSGTLKPLCRILSL